MPVPCTAFGWWPPGCGLVSGAQDGVNSMIASVLAGILQTVAAWIWSFITGAFSVSDLDDSQWTAIQGLTGWWVVVMMTPLVVVMILELLAGLISQHGRRILRALAAGAAAVPLVAGAIYLIRQLTRVSDSASAALLGSLGTDPYVVFMRLFGFQRVTDAAGTRWNLATPVAPATGDGPVGSVVVTVMAMLIVWILAFVLMCSMLFRSFALVVLAATAPVALMLLPWEKTASWARRWSELVIALLLAKPLAATVLAVAIKLFAGSTSFAGLAAGTVGMLLACGAPLMALRLVSFAGGELAAAAQTAGGGHVLTRSSAILTRQVSKQAGGRLTLAALATHPVKSSPPPVSQDRYRVEKPPQAARPDTHAQQRAGTVTPGQPVRPDAAGPGTSPPPPTTKTTDRPDGGDRRDG